MELGIGATNSEATRVPIFLERGATFGVACNGAAGAGTVETRGRGAVALCGPCVAKFGKSTSEPSLGSSRGLHCALA